MGLNGIHSGTRRAERSWGLLFALTILTVLAARAASAQLQTDSQLILLQSFLQQLLQVPEQEAVQSRVVAAVQPQVQLLELVEQPQLLQLVEQQQQQQQLRQLQQQQQQQQLRQLQQQQVVVQPQPQRVKPNKTRQRQKPPANDTDKPQFLDPGVGRWLLNGDQACLPCICEAASGCDETLGCDDRGFCGPFLLSQRYWQLSGKPLLRGDSQDRPGASSDCLRDPFCAAEAVRGYLDRFAQDCDGDRRVDCLDLARVHFQGPFNCRAQLQPPNDFSETFRRCWDASRRNQQR